jgi:hypothetical protein
MVQKIVYYLVSDAPSRQVCGLPGEGGGMRRGDRVDDTPPPVAGRLFRRIPVFLVGEIPFLLTWGASVHGTLEVSQNT